MHAIGHQINVLQCLISGVVGHLAYLYTSQPFHPGNALHAGHHQPQRKSVFRSQVFAILSIGDQHFVIFDQFHRDRARQSGSISALGQHIAGFCKIDATALE